MNPRADSAGQGEGGAKKPPCQVSFLAGNQTFRGTSYHFNERGILVLCAQPAPLKARVKLQIRIPGLSHTVKLEGEVVWTNIHGHADVVSPRGMGIRFVNLDPDTARLLGEAAERYGATPSQYACYFE